MTFEEILQRPDYQAWVRGRQPRTAERAERLMAIIVRINSHLPPVDGGIAVEIQHDRLDQVGQNL